MPQARLPDINAAFTKHRNQVISSLRSGDYDSVLGSIVALNGLLPDKIDENTNMPVYRVIMSDQVYLKLTKNQTTLICYHCGQEHNYESVKIFTSHLTGIIQIITKQHTQKVWYCPSCKQICIITKTEMTQTKHQEPNFVGAVPMPPRRHDLGMLSRTRYVIKMKQWANTTLAELEAKMAQFRDDNWTKADQDLQDMEEFTDAGEEQ